MDFSGKLLDLVTGGLGELAIEAIPEHWKKRALVRIADHNPFDVIADNHDLIRATRIAWIEAALDRPIARR
jgi:hypothetical protein